MLGMTKRKTSITVDDVKMAKANQVIDSHNFSETVDRALDALIAQERARQDLEGYRRQPQTQDEAALAHTALLVPDGDDTDWEALYP
jgi:Arc/MetJ family transcription regulator